MLSSELVSAYQQYKQDTESIAAWLASTAKRLGFTSFEPPPVTEPSNKPVTNGRLKGRDHLLAKKQAVGTPPVEGERPAGPRYIISIKDYTALAEYIAKKSVSVPCDFSTTLNRVITARTQFRAKLGKHTRFLDEEDDSKHKHFVNVLETVREILKPFMEDDKGQEASTSTSDLHNSFANSELHVPSQDFLEAPDVEIPAKSEGDQATYVSEPQKSLEDAIFSLMVVLHDISQIRSRLKRIWSEYKTGAFDLVTAAITTNTATDLVQNMMQDVEPLLELHGGVGLMLKNIFIVKCQTDGWSTEIIARGLKGKDHETYDIASETLFTTYRLLRFFKHCQIIQHYRAILRACNTSPNTEAVYYREIQSISAVLQKDPISPTPQTDHITPYREGMFGHYDPTSGHDQKTGRQKFEDDRALLLPFLDGLKNEKHWPAPDGFTRGIYEIVNNYQVPFYTLFAAQVFLDITYVLGKDIKNPFSTMYKQITAMDKDIKAYAEFHSKLKLPAWPASHGQLMRKFQEYIGAVTAAKHQLFRMSPAASGIILYQCRSTYRSLGLGVANTRGSIQSCQHLYNALHQQNILKCSWPDMDVAYTQLGADNFYVGAKPPTSPKEMYIVTFATRRPRGEITPMSLKLKPRTIKAGCPILATFKTQYILHRARVDMTAEKLKQIIELSLVKQEDSEEGETRMFGHVEGDEKFRGRQKKHQIKNGRNTRKTTVNENRATPPQQLINSLALALQAEMLEFSFPYLKFHRCCWQALRAVKESCHLSLTQVFGPGYIKREKHLPWMVNYILLAAIAPGQDAGECKALREAAKALETFIQGGFGDFIISNVLEETFSRCK
ncbi:hypothetical protein GGR58DRAFT_456931 [Xylaria digitata]|nr:hypothetical protein GGR58DRAFT_456931 [Xylaria digitata]